eukprot:scaffold53974_cov59-Phaeocystis_antarctica.AAC.1
MSPCASPRLSVVAWPLQPSAPLPALPAIARREAPPPRRWRSSPGSPSCRRASSAPRMGWLWCACRGSHRSIPSCSWPQAASVSPPAPAAEPPRSSAAPAPLQPSPPPPAPLVFARRTAPPPRR